MIKSMRVGNTVICVIRSKMFQKTFETDGELLDLYEKALNTDETNDEEVISLMKEFEPKLTYEEKQRRDQHEKDVAEAEKSKDLIAWMEDIKNLGDEHFRVEGLKLYMKGIDITVPEFLAREFASRRDNEEDLRSLQNFWRLCALNPDPRCREDLYKFLMNNNMVVTPTGYFLAYRNADVKEKGNQELNEFVGLQYTKIKNWKKSPKNYSIVEIFDGETTEYNCVAIDKLQRLEEDDSLEVEYIGNLQNLYELLDTDIDATVYTDNWSRTTTIKIGSPVSIPRSECDSNPDQTCSNGLHLGNVGFMSQGSFGKVGLVCLCNPMNVVAVPYAGGEKLRTTEYLPIGIAEYDEYGKIVPITTTTFEHDYSEHTEEELLKMLSTSSFESLKDHEIIPKELRLENFKLIVDEFIKVNSEINEEIKSRVIDLD